MQAMILAGGLGSRLSEETVVKPKPMVEVGGSPILWHIMKMYAVHNITDFVICLGYKGYIIKEYFVNYFTHTSDIMVNLAANTTEVLSVGSEPWRVKLIDTGSSTMTGGRVKRALPHIEGDEFYLSYGDGVSDVDLTELLAVHHRNRKLATITAVQPPGRFGAIRTVGSLVTDFMEKPAGDGNWINGGFFVFNRRVGELIEDDATVLEAGPLPELAGMGELAVHSHRGFWHPMDTLRDKEHLESLWRSGSPPWKKWKGSR